MLKNAFLMMGLVAAVAPAMAEMDWTSDLDAARQKAAAEGKALLLDFTGSDWCGWCIRLRKDVLSKPEFEAYAADKFVPVEIDVPQNPKFDAALRQRNQQLCEKYHVSGFPTIMVLTPEGQVAGGFCGGRPNFEAAKPELDTAVANAAKLTAAEKLEGADKVKALMEVYSSLSGDMQESAAEMRDAIVALDPEDTTGLRRAKEAKAEQAAIMEKVQGGENDKERLILVNDLLDTVMPENRIHVLRLKSRLLMATAETEEDIIAARDAALEGAALNTKNGDKERAAIERAFADPALVLSRVKELRAKLDAAPKKK